MQTATKTEHETERKTVKLSPASYDLIESLLSHTIAVYQREDNNGKAVEAILTLAELRGQL